MFLAKWLRAFAECLGAQAEWIEDQSAEIKEKYEAVLQANRVILLIVFLLGVAAGFRLKG